MENIHKVLLVMLIFFCSTIPTFSNQNTLTPNQFIQHNETLVSAGGTFEAGFFNFGDPQRQYFGIWYKSILPRTIVWVANRETPVQNSTGLLKLNDQGNLVIHDDSKGVVWSSNSSRIVVKPAAVQLLDSGNLVVKDANSTVNFFWESFDYPGNTFLAGMKLKSNLVTGPYKYLTSWRSSEDPAEGECSHRIDTHGFPQLVTAKGATFLYRAGSWNGFLFTGISWQRLSRILNYSVVFTDKEFSYQYETMNSSIITIMVLDPSGNSQRLLWSNKSQVWEDIANRPADLCDNYALCGINSNCNINDFPICECLEGFMPKFQTKWDSSNWSDGCVRKTHLNCLRGDGFLKYTSMKLPDTSSSWFDKSMSLEKCKTVCLKNCSCTAYANLDIRYGGSGCLLWFDNIVDMRVHPDQGQDIYIRLASSEFDHKKNTRNLKRAGTLAGVIAFIIGLTIIVLVTSAYKKRLGCIKVLLHKKEKEDVDLATIFDFSTIANATNHFSNRNKLGEGGFGPVYKGIMVDGQEIAVKRLSKTSGQGTEEFKNEVLLMATLQHRNLVKLLGCSIQQDEKLLIYEFMPNKSLDCFIFDATRSKLLDWRKRLEIIDGIARGLLYLHQDSTLRIIHRDLKTSNILLDIDMIPKISDFGLARSFMGDQAEANTNRVMGTYGYMPPEYAVRGSFSIKSDVFSFGVVVLEIISGKKNSGFDDPQNHLNLLGHAWRLWIEERPHEFIADISYDADICSEIIRFIHVGLLCVQQQPENRPNMSSVVFMLKGEKLLPKPSEPGFYGGRDDINNTGSSSKGCSINEASMSLLEGR
ncbi:G-type lectin S-receptor-like serine/threonine-protein kinase At4g27290 isoform X2 [Vicia villosa]|uniref:G-type lectin S-receptor-like serine/threonine-protein kinase At4g27290 isoform X2 n=1 Tax=Vicia villosa TaxID=3911 RepID=UPI00273B05AA|nr:G-type lectin S-receptor-like serine/threonine-protein kinase At4g27290 isoform X2 [Vicia villosa]